MFKFSICFCFIAFISLIDNSIEHHREKRFLIFPRGNPTRHQFVAGIGMPVDIEPESMIIGYVFKAQYFLPYNVSQLKPTRLERSAMDDSDSYRATKVSNDDSVRWTIYNAMDTVLREKMKIDGTQCVLRAICEMTQLPFSHESGLLGELLHILFVPSTTASATSAMSNDYTFAEDIGKSAENCENVFRKCTFSLLSLFSALHNF